MNKVISFIMNFDIPQIVGIALCIGALLGVLIIECARRTAEKWG